MKVVLLVGFLAGCTTLGPMPATTGISAIPAGRPGFEAQVGAVPGFFLSRAAQDRSGGTPILQLSGLMDVDRWVGVPGLLVGARLFGQDKDTPGEPYVGYRKQLSDELAVGGVVYGTSKRSTRNLASYHATRVGAEVMADGQMWAPASWFALHFQMALAATRIFASGTYCVDAMGVAKDCDTSTSSNNTMIDGTLSGVFPSATLTIGLDLGRRPTGIFHGARLALLAALGKMPLVRDGREEASDVYSTLGVTLTLGMGDQD